MMDEFESILKTLFGGTLAVISLLLLGQFIVFSGIALLGFIGTLAATGNQQWPSGWLLTGLAISTVFFTFSIWGFMKVGLEGLKKIK